MLALANQSTAHGLEANQLTVISVVQLCSVLVHSQSKSVDLYLASWPPPLPSPPGQMPDIDATPDSSTLDAMRTIRKEVEDKLQYLHNMVQV